MGKTNKRSKEVRKRIYQSRNNDPGPSFRRTISVFRSVVPSPELADCIRPLQSDIAHFIEDLGFGSTEKLAINGLYMNLLPPYDLDSIRERLPDLNHPAKVRKHIAQQLPHREETLQDVKALRGIVQRDDIGTFAALTFRDERLTDEAHATRRAIYAPYALRGLPFVVVCHIPELEQSDVDDLVRDMWRFVPRITASFGPIEFG